MSVFQENERRRAVRHINGKHPLFDADPGRGIFMRRTRDFVLKRAGNNLYEPIRSSAPRYFQENRISPWGGKALTGHVLSSQIACLNHLFAIRNDREAVTALLKNISAEFSEALPIETDAAPPGYIQFEAVSSHDLLNEKSLTRGTQCTSVDALIYAQRKDGARWLVPIEWKYTEHYGNQNKRTEGQKKNPQQYKGLECGFRPIVSTGIGTS